MKLIQGGLIKTMTSGDIPNGQVLIDGSKIVAVGQNLDVPAGTEIIDAAGCIVTPGFVDAHCHIGIHEEATRWEGNDTNEYSSPVTPEIRAIDGINPMDEAFGNAIGGGVTTAVTGPGSANVLGGSFVAMKLYGDCIDDMILKYPAAMKCAFGENPKRCYRDKSITSRMSTAAKLRDILFRAREYQRKVDLAGDDESKLPAFNLQLHAMLPVMRGQIPLKAHAHQANDILTAMRIAKEFGVKLTLEHVTDGALIVDELARANVPLAVGPTFGQPSKIELKNKSWQTPGILNKAGCHVSIITDSPVTEQRHLRFCAAMAINGGMDPFEAFRAVTLYPAEHIGIANRVGSIEVGKDADFALMDGDLFSLQTKVVATYILGSPVR